MEREHFKREEAESRDGSRKITVTSHTHRLQQPTRSPSWPSPRGLCPYPGTSQAKEIKGLCAHLLLELFLGLVRGGQEKPENFHSASVLAAFNVG